MTSTTPRPCAGCSRDLGYVMHTLNITYNGWRYEVCGHVVGQRNGCAERLMQRLTASSSSTSAATVDTLVVPSFFTASGSGKP
ncbi:MAG: hypothetical protein EB084_22595 [Proteobacteria bacterium]|nr:hypothetical protein [Pseudomonadota bacterium]